MNSQEEIRINHPSALRDAASTIPEIPQTANIYVFSATFEGECERDSFLSCLELLTTPLNVSGKPDGVSREVSSVNDGRTLIEPSPGISSLSSPQVIAGDGRY